MIPPPLPQKKKKPGLNRVKLVGTKTAGNIYNYIKVNNFLLTERECRTGEYWLEVVAVRTERSEFRTKTTEDQYSQYGSSKLC